MNTKTKKTMKRSLALFMTVLMALSCFSLGLTVTAAVEGYPTREDLDWFTKDNPTMFGAETWDGTTGSETVYSEGFGSHWNTGSYTAENFCAVDYPGQIYLNVGESLEAAGYYAHMTAHYGNKRDHRIMINSLIWGETDRSGYNGIYNLIPDYDHQGTVSEGVSVYPDTTSSKTDFDFSNDAYGANNLPNSGEGFEGEMEKMVVWRVPYDDATVYSFDEYVFLKGTAAQTGTYTFGTGGVNPLLICAQDWQAYSYFSSDAKVRKDDLTSSSVMDGQWKELRVNVTVYDKADLAAVIAAIDAGTLTADANAVAAARAVLTDREVTQAQIDAALESVGGKMALLVLDNAGNYTTGGDPFGTAANTFDAHAFHQGADTYGAYQNLVYAPAWSTSWSGNGIGDTATSVGRIDFKVAIPRNVVMVYDGAHDAYAPITLESRCNDTGGSSHIIHYVDYNSATAYELKNDFWQGYSTQWDVWAKDNIDDDKSEQFAAYWHDGGAPGESPDSQRDGNSRFWWNMIYYAAQTGNTTNYYDHATNFTFDAHTSYKTTSRQHKYGTFTSLTDFYTINYQPIYTKLTDAAAVKAIIDGDTAWQYTDASVNRAKATIAAMVASNPNNFFNNNQKFVDNDYDADSAAVAAAVVNCASAIKDAAYMLDHNGLTLEKKTGTATFLKPDGTQLQVITADYGDTITVPDVPEKAPTAQYTYTDGAWSPAATPGSAVMSDNFAGVTFNPTYTKNTRSYTITWKYQTAEGEQTVTDTLEFGAMPTAPAAAGDYQTVSTNYTFTGWDSEIVTVSGEKTYTATYTDAPRTYTVTFVDEDGTTVLKPAAAYAYGTEISAIAPEATKNDDAIHTYAFDAWTPADATVTGAATYTASYTAALNSTATAAVNTANGILEDTENEYDATYLSDLAAAKDAVANCPVDATDKQDRIDELNRLNGLAADNALTTVDTSALSAAITVAADIVTAENAEKIYTDTTLNALNAALPGAQAVLTQYDGVQIKTSEKDAAETAIANAAASLTGIAVTKISYTVTWRIDGAETPEAAYNYGDMPSYKGETPTREARAIYSYTFDQWTPAFAAVEDNDDVYTATFTEAKTIDATDAIAAAEAIIADVGNYDADYIAALTAAKDAVANCDKEATNEAQQALLNALLTGDNGINKAADNALTTIDTSALSAAITAATSIVTAENAEKIYTDTTLNALNAALPGAQAVLAQYDGVQIKTSDVAAAETAIAEAAASLTGIAVTKITYTVTWSIDGTETPEAAYNYGDMPSYKGETPTREARAIYSYTFNAWTPAFAAVEDNDDVYTATFTEAKTIDATDAIAAAEAIIADADNYDADYIAALTAAKDAVANCDKEATNEAQQALLNALLTGDNGINKAADNALTTVDTSALSAAIAAATSIVNAENADKIYTDTTLNALNAALPDAQAVLTQYDGVQIKTSDVAAAETAIAEAAASLTGIAVTKITYTVTWRIDGAETPEAAYNYGDMPSYKGETPTREARAIYSYTFDQWTPAFAAVEDNDDVYTATFTGTKTNDANAAVASAQSIINNASQYDADYIAGLTAAKDAVANCDKEATNEAQQALLNALLTGDNGINKAADNKLTTVDTSVLAELITAKQEAHDAASADVYTAASIAALQDAIDAAQAVLDANAGTYKASEAAEKQAAIDAAYNTLNGVTLVELDSFTITWNVDGTETTTACAAGTTPVFDGTPTRDARAIYSYTFDKWTPDVAAATGDATYTATFTAVKTAAATDAIAAAEAIIADADNYDADYIAALTAAKNAVVNCDKEATSEAQQALLNALLTGDNGINKAADNKLTTVDTSALAELITAKQAAHDAASADVYTAESIAALQDAIDAAQAVLNANAGTYKASEAAEKQAAIDAAYNTLNGVTLVTIETFEITWIVDGVGTTGSFATGTTPTFSGSTAKESDDLYDYTFTGWDPEVAAVTGTATYTAQYTKAYKEAVQAVIDEATTVIASGDYDDDYTDDLQALLDVLDDSKLPVAADEEKLEALSDLQDLLAEKDDHTDVLDEYADYDSVKAQVEALLDNENLTPEQKANAEAQVAALEQTIVGDDNNRFQKPGTAEEIAAVTDATDAMRDLLNELNSILIGYVTQHTLTINYDNGVVAVFYHQDYYGNTYTLPERVAKEGFTFDHWELDGEGTLNGNVFTFGKGDATVTARYVAPELIVNIDKDGDGFIDEVIHTTYQEGVKIACPVAGTKDGYTFTGKWNDNDGNTYAATGGMLTLVLPKKGTSITLTAQFKKDSGSGDSGSGDSSAFRCKLCDRNDAIQASNAFIGYKIIWKIVHFFVHLIQSIGNWT